MQMRVKLMECGKQPSGRVYSTGMMAKAAEEFMKQGLRPVYLDGAVDSVVNDLSRVAGVVNNMEMDGNTLYADISLLGTPDGETMKAMLSETPDSVQFGVRGTGKIIEGNAGDGFKMPPIVDEFQILSVDLMKK